MKQAILLLLFLPLVGFAQQRTISVSGTSTIVVKPDFAMFTVNIDREIPLAQKWNFPAPDGFVDALVAAGISPQDIEVLERMPAPKPEPPFSFDMTPPPAPEPEEEPEMTRSKRKPTGASDAVIEEVPVSAPATKLVRTKYRVKVQNLPALPEAIAIAQQMSNSLPDARYEVSDRNPLKMRALREALDNAHAKAKVLAEKMGGKLGEIISIDDSESGGFFSSLFDIARMVSSGQFDSGFTNLPEIASVKVVYEIE